MSDIRKRNGTKGATYQVRYASKASKTGYAYAAFETLKEARSFTENLGSLRHSSSTLEVTDAVDRWLEICEKVGRDGRETVEPETLKEYRRRAGVMQEYAWTKSIPELEPPDVIKFRNWLLESKTRDLARRTLSSFHSVLIEMQREGHRNDDPAAGITIRSDGRYEAEDDEVVILPTPKLRSFSLRPQSCNRRTTTWLNVGRAIGQ